MPIFANVLQPLISVFEWILTTIHDSLGFSWGWSIVAMTIVVRTLLLPVAIRQFKSMRAMQRLGPEIKALRDKYGQDRERLSQETMKLYQEHRVNPAGACLPLVFQLPVFISLFYMLRHDLRYDICPQINLNAAGEKITGTVDGQSYPLPCGNIPAAHFLGIPDITNKATGTVLIILLVLYVGTQLVSTLVMAQPNMDPKQRYLMLALPVVFVPFVIGFPAGLLVYWITTNLWTLGQQFTIRETLGRRWDHQHAAALEAAGGDLAVMHAGKKPGMFSSMMSRAQEAQQQGKADGDVSARGTRARSGSGTTASKPKSSGNGSKTSGGEETARRSSAPPPPPRKKKKRSGRRR